MHIHSVAKLRGESMKFFKSEDFSSFEQWIGNMQLKFNDVSLTKLADISNDKLERDAKFLTRVGDYWYETDFGDWLNSFNRALLICQEKREVCKHPVEKVKFETRIVSDKSDFIGKEFTQLMVNEVAWYQCECGAKVKPKEFEVCE